MYKRLYTTVGTFKGLGQYLVDLSPKEKPKPSLEYANQLAKILYKGKDLKALAAAGRGFYGLEVKLTDLKRCKAPSLFVYGENDASRSEIERTQLELAGSEKKMIKGADHMTTPARPEFGASIVGFLLAHKAK